MSPEPPTLSVLVVDDNADSAEMLQALLERYEFRVSIALDGTSALDACTKDPPDVVLLDLGLPDIGGAEVARRLRLMPEMAKSRIVALSGYGEHDAPTSPRQGFDAHLTKPVDPDRLIRELRRAKSG
jgi:CheY-like chemotaxis protein